MKKINFNNSVVVIGAGSAGVAAAVAAAKSGAKVILVEHYGFVGGLATSAMVGTVCGLFYRNKDKPVYAVQGFARQFSEGLRAKSQTQVTTFAEGLHFLPYQTSAFHQQAVQELKLAGVQLLLHSSVTDVSVSDGEVVELLIQSSDKNIKIQPLSIVDCTGNAQISLLAAVERITESEYQSGAFVFQVSGLPEMASRLLSLTLIRCIKRGIQAGDLEPACECLSIVPGSIRNGSGLFKLGMQIPYNDSIGFLTQYELEARERSVKVIEYLQASEKTLSNLIILAMATQIGIRSSARSKGITILDKKHVLDCQKPDDGIAIGAWPIEYWEHHYKPTMQYFNFDDCYWIPASTLVSPCLNNLFFAGRAMSATEMALASSRVIGTCLNTGYAAGMLAAEYVQHGRWQTAIDKIQQQQIFAK